MRNYSFKWGRLLLFRWLIVSWVLQGIHVYDKTERNLRILIELLLFILVLIYNIFIPLSITTILLFVIIIHTIFWFTDSHWLVGFREVYKGFKGKGIDSIVEYSDYVIKILERSDKIVFIGIFGSLCRSVYHDRSDLDLRIVQNNGLNIKLFFTIQYLRFIGIWKYRIPIDLKLVDNIAFLKHEMRNDEYPIVLFSNSLYYENQIDFLDFKNNRYNFIKKP